MSTQKGKLLENGLVNNINANTDEQITAYPCGYSGNHVGPSPDILITTPQWNHAIEIKNTRKDKKRIFSDDIDQLIACQNDGTRTWIAIDYNNRELLFVEVPHDTELLHGEQKREWLVKRTPDCFNPRTGRTGTYWTDKPSLDEWVSKQSGRENWRVVCESIGVNGHIEVDE